MTTTEIHPTDALNAKVKAMTDRELLAATGALDRQTRYQAEKELIARCPFKYPTPEMAVIQGIVRVTLDETEPALRTPEEQAKINERMARARAARKPK